MITLSDIERLIAEDVPGADVTTEALGIGAMPAVMQFAARGRMVVAGTGLAARILAGAQVERFADDGDDVAAGTPLMTARGPAGLLHRGWKVTQTAIEILSGIATATRDLVEAAAAVRPGLRIATTRKTVPGARALSQLAVKAGGGILHRSGLSDTILVFAEHRAFLSGRSLADLAGQLRTNQPEKALGIEVSGREEAEEAILAGFDVIQLEKWSPEAVASLVAWARDAGLVDALRHRPLISAAGGISPENVGAYADAGAGLIVTSWPYTARPCDVAVRLEPDVD
ncbi:MAG: ModD protein [Ancalomicrobiaceae bacterium]|nr:ModD protein [Ancalomicrobiaceae bacterium]